MNNFLNTFLIFFQKHYGLRAPAVHGVSSLKKSSETRFLEIVHSENSFQNDAFLEQE